MTNISSTCTDEDKKKYVFNMDWSLQTSNAEIDALRYHYDISDTTALYETFSLVVLTKIIEENGLRVEYKKLRASFDG